jgi:dTDP-glucose pyrophosphorylase
VKNVILLCAGRSSRFGRNKLEESFNGKTLPTLAAEFARDNGCENLFLTLSQSGVKTDGRKVYHPILDQVSQVIEPTVRFQDPDTYGPGAAITSWAGVLDEPFVVLFGDNFYRGKVPDGFLNSMADPLEKRVIATSLDKGSNPRNLQLAAVSDSYLIEKPHGILSGEYFCGFVRFPSGFLNDLGPLQKSDRGEIEIADMINMAEDRVWLSLKNLGIIWGDLTYESDCENIRRLVSERK